MQENKELTPEEQEEIRKMLELRRKYEAEWRDPYADYVGDMEDALENS